jgi:glucosamine-6-phosphate deaminase
MRVIVCRDQTALTTVGADEIAAVVRAKPTAAVVLATGNSPMGIYSELGARSARGQLDATQLRVFQLDEYFGLADNDGRSLFGWMDRAFLQPMRVPLQNVVRLRSGSGNDWRNQCRQYDEAVAAAGGFDLAVLGIGPNGHLAYNEPGSHAHSPTRALLLTEASTLSSAEYWGGRANAPLAGITCGMTHLLAARQIVLVASGQKKREILERALHGPIGPEVPASYLQTVSDRLIVLCDEAAAPRSALADSDTEHGAASAVSAPAVVSGDGRSLVLGVDGGNSKTVALIAEKNGRILGYGRGGGGDMYGATPQGALHSVETAVQAALSIAGVAAERIEAATFSMAGADWPEDYRLLESLFARHAPKISVVNDSVGALRSGSPESWGVGLVCGSWVASAARARGGGQWIKSLWHPNGGGGGLALDALTAVYKAAMSMAPETALTQAVLSFFKQDNVEGLVHQFTKREGPRPQAIQRLAPAVLDAALAGDAVATALLVRQGENLGAVALSLARQVGIDRQAFPLVLSGGVFRHRCELLPAAIGATVRAQAPRAQVHRNDLEPVAGAVMLAIELAGKRCPKAVRTRLRSTMPDRSFFAT